MARWLAEYLAHLGVTQGCALLIHQAAVLDGSALDALARQQDGLPSAEIENAAAQREGCSTL
ncbi:MAG: hypothetical protein ACK5VT_03165 [Alphaproteobacteria bacterium]